MIRIEAENALKMTEQEMLDVVFEASENSVVELNVVDPDSIYRALVDQVEEVA